MKPNVYYRLESGPQVSPVPRVCLSCEQHTDGNHASFLTCDQFGHTGREYQCGGCFEMTLAVSKQFWGDLLTTKEDQR